MCYILVPRYTMCSHVSHRPAHWGQQPCIRIQRALDEINNPKYHDVVPVDPALVSNHNIPKSSPLPNTVTPASLDRLPSDLSEAAPTLPAPAAGVPATSTAVNQVPAEFSAKTDPETEPEPGFQEITVHCTASPPLMILPFRIPNGCVRQPRKVEKPVHGWCPDCDWEHARRMGWLGRGGKVRAWDPAGSGWGGS